MKITSWILVLVLLVFGLGWTAAHLAARESSSALRDSDLNTSANTNSGRDGPHSRCGPFLRSVDQFAERLALTAEQRTQMDAIVADTTQRVREHEKSIWDVKHQTRPRILALLTPEQQSTLDRLIDEERTAWQASKVDRRMEWVLQQDLSAAAVASVRQILTRYEQAKSAFFVQLMEAETLPAEGSVEEHMNSLQEQRDEELQKILGDSLLEQFRSASGGRRGPQR